MAFAILSGPSTRTNFAPASRMALSNALRPPTMMTSCFIPVGSGSCQIFCGSLPAMHAAVEAAIAPAAPLVTKPDSAPVNSASFRPAARCRSTMLTKWCEASACAARTSGNCNDPLKYVQVPRQLITVLTPKRVYTFSLGSNPIAAADFSYNPWAASCASNGDAANIFMNPRRLDS